MNAYSSLYLNEAQDWLGEFLETSICVLKMELKEVWDLFTCSQYSLSFGDGDPFVILGKSGSEVAFELCNKRVDKLPFIYDRTPEYWLGYSLAYYEWEKNIPFAFITRSIGIDVILLMYKKYHEMDISHFVDEIDRLRSLNKKETNLKRIRRKCGLSQKELAVITSIPIRTIQQYEQRQKNINKAQANYIISLAQALNCSPKELLE